MNSKLIKLVILTSIVFGEGAFDSGTSAGKGIWDISITINPNNYFKQGQTYAMIAYGITEKIDIHSYYSFYHLGSDNYYAGILYQFYKSRTLDLSTGFGIRKYNDSNRSHYFFPQILFTKKFNKKFSMGGSIVNLINKKNNFSLGKTHDLFFSTEIYENNKFKLKISLGLFNPVLWTPENGNWYPTYSIDIKIK